MIKPDYKGGSIVNLMSSLIKSRGGKSKYRELKLLKASELKRVKNVVLLVLDGMGVSTLTEHSPNGFFMKHLRGKMTTVFPSTTATAMTTYTTGEAPQQHGLTGWNTYFRKIGAVAKILPFVYKGGGSLEHYTSDMFVCCNGVYDKMRTKSFQVIPDYINGPFTKGMQGKAKIYAYKTEKTLFTKLRMVLKKPGKKYVHAYWDGIDHASHLSGPNSEEAKEALLRMERQVERFCKKLPKGTHLIISADHGQVHTPKQVFLSDYPKITECLILPPCGEPRAMSLYVRPGKVKQFEKQMKRISKHCDIVKGEHLIKRGYFGLYKACEELYYRVGDYVLLPKEGVSIEIEPGPHVFEGNHGGLTKEEMKVPLIHIH